MSKWGSFPWCNAPFATSSDVGPNSFGQYPCRFTAAQMLSAWDKNTWDFNIHAQRGITDVTVEIIEAMALVSIGGLLALGIAIVPLLQTAAARTGVLGTMTRREQSDKCVATRFVYNHSLCYIEIDLSDVVREQTTTVTWYYPRMRIIFYSDKCVWSNEITFLIGAAEVGGYSIELAGASSFIDRLFAVKLDGQPPLEVFYSGSITPGENIDLMDFTPRSTVAGADVAITGITFAPITEVWFGGGQSAVVTQSTDRKRVTARVPAGATRDYIILRGGEFEYATRIPFIPA